MEQPHHAHGQGRGSSLTVLWWRMDHRLELDILSWMPIPLFTTQIGEQVVKK
jgi:hypothetical protein